MIQGWRGKAEREGRGGRESRGGREMGRRQGGWEESRRNWASILHQLLLVMSLCLSSRSWFLSVRTPFRDRSQPCSSLRNQGRLSSRVSVSHMPILIQRRTRQSRLWGGGLSLRAGCREGSPLEKRLLPHLGVSDTVFFLILLPRELGESAYFIRVSHRVVYSSPMSSVPRI